MSAIEGLQTPKEKRACNCYYSLCAYQKIKIVTLSVSCLYEWCWPDSKINVTIIESVDSISRDDPDVTYT